MKIYDMHIHADYGAPSAEALLAKMEAVGIYGGAVISQPPLEADGGANTAYEERIQRVLGWTKGCEGRLFPVLWIHPLEKDLDKKLHDAVARGITAFKMICDNYYVHDAASMAALHTIAALGKPVIFHSGILWNGGISSRYNQPVNWEAVLSVPNLRFSLAHCAWPWYDECIALYGKFTNAYAENPNVSCEMFLDLTPGTPEIYREDLLHKLFYVGYDVPHNIMFGTDSNAASYGGNWVKGWVATDNALYDKLGISEKIRAMVYGDNFLRFIGVKEKDFTHRLPTPDSAIAWRPCDIK